MTYCLTTYDIHKDKVQRSMDVSSMSGKLDEEALESFVESICFNSKHSGVGGWV